MYFMQFKNTIINLAAIQHIEPTERGCRIQFSYYSDYIELDKEDSKTLNEAINAFNKAKRESMRKILPNEKFFSDED